MDRFFTHHNVIKSISEHDRAKLADFLAPIIAVSRITYKNIYVIDYYKQCFDYVSANPFFLCGMSAEEVKEMGYAFYFKVVAERDLDMLARINKAGFKFLENVPLNERLLYSISYDFRVKSESGNLILVNHKLTPLFLTQEGKLWKALCLVSLSDKSKPGNVRIYKQNENIFWQYNLTTNSWVKGEKIILSERERDILFLSTQGLKVPEIGEKINLSPDTIKFHRRKIFEKLEVSNITEAIFIAINNRLI